MNQKRVLRCLREVKHLSALAKYADHDESASIGWAMLQASALKRLDYDTRITAPSAIAAHYDRIKDAIASGAEVVMLGKWHAKAALQHCDEDRWLCFEVGSF